jgi:hypothetical protein
VAWQTISSERQLEHTGVELGFRWSDCSLRSWPA